MFGIGATTVRREVTEPEILRHSFAAVVQKCALIRIPIWQVEGHDGAKTCVGMPKPPSDSIESKDPNKKGSLPSPGNCSELMHIPHMPGTDPMLSMIAGRAQGFSVRCIPSIACCAKQGSQSGGLRKGTNGFPEGFARQTLEGVANAV